MAWHGGRAVPGGISGIFSMARDATLARGDKTGVAFLLPGARPSLSRRKEAGGKRQQTAAVSLMLFLGLWFSPCAVLATFLCRLQLLHAAHLLLTACA